MAAYISLVGSMKITWRIITVVFLLFLVTAPVFNFPKKAEAGNATSNGNFYVGITYGSDSVAEAKSLIDNVSGYTNLFVVDSAAISGASNSTALDEICDYAVNANMSVIVYFYMIYYNVTAKIGSVYNASTWDAYGISPWHVSWLNSTEERWGDKFLGVYLFDEPGGKQIDTGYWGGNNVTFSGSTVHTFDNVSSYDDAAHRYISTISTNRGMQILSNTSYSNGLNYTIPAFTSDYALYWFDYKSGYNTVFVELGGNRGVNNKTQQIALCRGAAQAQNKDWGAIITWATDNPPTPETGANMLQDMTLAYEAGAKYVVAFNYAVNGTGGLADEQFGALKQFWTNTHDSPRDTNAQATGQVAFVLPTNYGLGMRTLNDRIWGLWPADNLSLQIWQNMNTLLGLYGSKLDIIYDDPQFNVTGMYNQTYLWNSTILVLNPPSPSPTPSGTSTSASANITVTASPAPATPSNTPTSKPSPTTGLSSPPRNYLSLFAEIVVPIGAIACIALYLFMRSKKPIESAFPTVPVNTNLKGFGSGMLQMSGETLSFNPKQGRFNKRAETAKQIELSRVESLNLKGNQISLQSNGQTDTFAFHKKLTPPVYTGIKAAWETQKKILEKAAAVPEQKQLKETFTTVAQTVDSLFDILLHLHGEIDWKNVEGCLGSRGEPSFSYSGAVVSATKMDLANLQAAIKQRQPDLVAKETRLALHSLYNQVLGLRSENQLFEQFHPNYGDLKTAILAYYALDDIMLGEAVGDADLADEKAKFVTVLNRLSNRGNSAENQNAFAAEALSKLTNGRAASIAKNRSLLAMQLAETLNPARV